MTVELRKDPTALSEQVSAGHATFCLDAPDPLAAFRTVKPSLAFKGEDRATQGNWIDVYGGNGYCLPTITPHLPADVFVQMEGAGSCVWEGKAATPNAL